MQLGESSFYCRPPRNCPAHRLRLHLSLPHQYCYQLLISPLINNCQQGIFYNIYYIVFTNIYKICTYNMHTYVYIDISTSILYIDIYFFCILYIYYTYLLYIRIYIQMYVQTFIYRYIFILYIAVRILPEQLNAHQPVSA